MEKEFIPYEQALALKELGFDEPCLAYRTKNTNQIKFGEGFELVTRHERRNVMNYPLINSRYIPGSNAPDGYYYLTTIPTFSQAFRWFREKYWLYSALHLNPRGYYTTISKKINNLTPCVFGSEVYNVPEEAELECLKKLIEIVKRK